MPFPDLIQEAVAIDEDKSQVESKKATLVVEAETNEKMYVLRTIFVPFLITICHHRF